MFGLGTMFGKAAIGGAVGYGLTGDWGGAAAGAGMAGLGWGTMSKSAGGAGIGEGVSKGLGKMGGYASKGAGWLGSSGLNSRLSPLGFAASHATDALRASSRGLGRAGSFMGQKALRTNQVAGAAFASLGVGASAYIGSSVLNSNRGR